MSYNKWILEGFLGAAPVIRYSGAGEPIIILSLATDKRVKKGESWVTEPVWHQAKAFGTRWEKTLKNCVKGSALLLEGTVDYEKWKDKETGQPRSQAVMLVDDVRFPSGSSKHRDAEEQD